MSRQRNAKVTAPVPDKAPVPHFLIKTELFALLLKGTTKTVMSWKEFEKRPAEIEVSTPGNDDKILCKVLNMHRCFHGFRPTGYPEKEASRGPSTVFEIEIIHVITNTDEPVNDKG